jgi:hypothetical protein
VKRLGQLGSSVKVDRIGPWPSAARFALGQVAEVDRPGVGVEVNFHTAYHPFEAGRFDWLVKRISEFIGG